MKQQPILEKDERVSLTRIIADCVQAQYRYLPDPADVDPHDLASESPAKSWTGFGRPGLTWFLGDP